MPDIELGTHANEALSHITAIRAIIKQRLDEQEVARESGSNQFDLDAYLSMKLTWQFLNRVDVGLQALKERLDEAT